MALLRVIGTASPPRQREQQPLCRPRVNGKKEPLFSFLPRAAAEGFVSTCGCAKLPAEPLAAAGSSRMTRKLSGLPGGGGPKENGMQRSGGWVRLARDDVDARGSMPDPCSCFLPPHRRGRLGAGISAHRPGLPYTGLVGFSWLSSAPRLRPASEPYSPATTLMPAQGDPGKKEPLFSFLPLFSRGFVGLRFALPNLRYP